MNPHTSNLAIVSSIRLDKKNALKAHVFHELTLALQTTLHVENLLELFSAHLQAVVPHESYGYDHPGQEIEVRAGKVGRHLCAYQLVLEDEFLGELRLTRSTRFSDQELAMIEVYLCRALYPLRNALLYRKALNSAHFDPLTDTRNRSALSGIFLREWELARRHATPLSVIMLDIDHFKTINDEHGHDVGDTTLRTVASGIKRCVRASDYVFRYGGEEFVVLLSNTAEEGAVYLAERIRETLATHPIVTDGPQTLKITASLGVATLNGHETADALLKRADLALYRAKRSGRNRVEVASSQAAAQNATS